MAEIDKIVTVNISRETTQIDTASFNIPLILAKPATAMPTRTAVYTTLKAVADAYGVTGKIYEIANRIFAQQLKPTQILVGHVQTRQEIDSSGNPIEVQETYIEALQEVIAENNTWYALVMDSHLPQDVEDMAGYIEGTYKIFGTSTQDINTTKASSTTDIAYILNSKGYDRTYLLYSEKADTEFPEAAWLWQLQFVAGSNTWAFTELAGVTVSRQLSDTQITALEKKKCNYYIKISGASIALTSQMVGGEWIDTIVLVDWMRARMQEAIFYRLVNSKKIPFTSTGAAIIETEIRNVISEAQDNGGISDDSPIIVISPRISDIPVTQRAQRVMGDFIWQATLGNAVHKVNVVGTVSY